MRASYEQRVLPAFERAHGRAPADGDEVHDAMQEERYFRFYSSIRYNAQEMVFRSVIPVVDRNLEELGARVRAAARQGGPESRPQGTQQRQPTSTCTCRPGSYHSEYQPDDVSAGAIYDNSINVFAFNQMGRNIDDIGHSLLPTTSAWPFRTSARAPSSTPAARSGTTRCPGPGPSPTRK